MPPCPFRHYATAYVYTVYIYIYTYVFCEYINIHNYIFNAYMYIYIIQLYITNLLSICLHIGESVALLARNM